MRDEDIGERAMEREIKRRVKLPLDDDERTARGRLREDYDEIAARGR